MTLWDVSFSHTWAEGTADVCTCTEVGECSGWCGWSPIQCVPEAQQVLFVCLDVTPWWSQDRALCKLSSHAEHEILADR